MTEEGMISLNEFKTALEDVRSDIKRVVEVMNHRFDRVEVDIHDLKHEVGILHEGQTALKAQFAEMQKEQTGLKGQFAEMQLAQAGLNGQFAEMRQEFKETRREHAEFKDELRRKADTEDVNKLTKRVARLERKSA